MVVGRRWGMWLEPCEGSQLPDEEFGDIVNRPIDYDTVIVHLIPEYYARWSERERGKTLIGNTVWELEKLPQSWPDALNQMDSLIVPCRWNRETFRAAGVTRPIAVVPHVGSPSLVAKRPFSVEGIEPDDFVFYTIAAWRERNAPYLALQSYLSAFTEADKTVFVIKTSRVNERLRHRRFWWHYVTRHIYAPLAEIKRIRKLSGSSARVVATADSMPDSEIQALHERGDCYVSLTHSEGWGLGAYDAAFAGNPVIITGYGGQLDYLPASLAYHVDYRMVPSRSAHPTWAGNGTSAPAWAEPDLAMGARLMREVFSHPEQARKRGARLQQFVREHFDADKIIESMLTFVRSRARDS